MTPPRAETADRHAQRGLPPDSSDAAVRDLFVVRESLEVLAARIAAERADRVGLDLLAAQLDIAPKATERKDGTANTAANAKFHVIIVDLAANPLRESLPARVQCHEHEELLAAIAEHHPDRAAVSAFHHVRAGRAQSLEMAAQWSRADVDPIELTKSRRSGGG